MKKWMIFSLLFCFSSEGLGWLCAKGDLGEVRDNISSEFTEDYYESAQNTIADMKRTSSSAGLVYECRDNILKLVDHSEELGWDCDSESLRGIIENQKCIVESCISNYELTLRKNNESFDAEIRKFENGTIDEGALSDELLLHCANVTQSVNALIKCVNNWINIVRQQCSERRLAVLMRGNSPRSISRKIRDDPKIRATSSEWQDLGTIIEGAVALCEEVSDLKFRVSALESRSEKRVEVLSSRSLASDYRVSRKQISCPLSDEWLYVGEGEKETDGGKRPILYGKGRLCCIPRPISIEGMFLNDCLLLSEKVTVRIGGREIMLGLNPYNITIEVTEQILPFTRDSFNKAKNFFVLTGKDNNKRIVFGNNLFKWGVITPEGSLCGEGMKVTIRTLEVGTFENDRLIEGESSDGQSCPALSLD